MRTKTFKLTNLTTGAEAIKPFPSYTHALRYLQGSPTDFYPSNKVCHPSLAYWVNIEEIKNDQGI